MHGCSLSPYFGFLFACKLSFVPRICLPTKQLILWLKRAYYTLNKMPSPLLSTRNDRVAHRKVQFPTKIWRMCWLRMSSPVSVKSNRSAFLDSVSPNASILTTYQRNIEPGHYDIERGVDATSVSSTFLSLPRQTSDCYSYIRRGLGQTTGSAIGPGKYRWELTTSQVQGPLAFSNLER